MGEIRSSFFCGPGTCSPMSTRPGLVAFTLAAVFACAGGPSALAQSVPAAVPVPPTRQAVAVGSGGAVATVDRDATRAGLAVLRRGGNAIDAAIAANAALGVTEPYVAGLGGGGFMVIYLAHSHRVITIDGRETGPAASRPTPSSTRRPASRSPSTPSA
jgi:gamma-glutamyltranspeptidase/glutathione hydrolase